MVLKVRETELADSFSVSLTECNEKKRSISIQKTLLSHHSFKSVPHTFGGMTSAFRETVFYSFSANVRFESETFGFRGNVMKYRQFGSEESFIQGAYYISSQLANNSIWKMPHQMNSLSVQGPPIVTKSLLNHSSLRSSLQIKPYFQGCLHSVAVFFQLWSRDVSWVFPFEILHQRK